MRMAERKIPTSFDYATIGPLRIEAREKLSRIRPINLDQAKRISGITPADIASGPGPSGGLLTSLGQEPHRGNSRR